MSVSNKQIAEYFNELASLMELHGEQDYRIKTYHFAARTLKTVSNPLFEMDIENLKKIKGVGDAVGARIIELKQTGQIRLLNTFREKTPIGVQELLHIKGIGAKKVKQLWEDLGIESLGELLYACHENRLILLKGFGQKTQEEVRKQVLYLLQSKDKFKYASVELEALEIIEWIKKRLPDAEVSWTGDLRRQMPVVYGISILVAYDGGAFDTIFDGEFINLKHSTENRFNCRSINGFPVFIIHTSLANFGKDLLLSTGSADFVKGLPDIALHYTDYLSEQGIFEAMGLPYIAPELRESHQILQTIQHSQFLNSLVKLSDIKGVIHAHTTYSDGANTLKEMATHTKDLGYEYLVVTDHSQSAFYANGLPPERVLLQWQEIEVLNTTFKDFYIFKGIESDILADGSLDYSEDILQGFELVIASIHSNLRMTEEKATARLLRAIENPYTTILGHPTGRLLLSREGYPIDHKKIIEACAANQVVIELNASPYRLDIDWTWIEFAQNKGVKIAINPDAHSIVGINDIRYGTMAARKGKLLKNNCLNTLSSEDIKVLLKNKNITNKS